MSLFDALCTDFTAILTSPDYLTKRLIPGGAVTLTHGNHMLFIGQYVREVALTRSGTMVELSGIIPNHSDQVVVIWVYFPWVTYKSTWREVRARLWLSITGRLQAHPFNVQPPGKSKHSSQVAIAI